MGRYVKSAGPRGGQGSPCELPLPFFSSQCEIFLTLAAGTRIRVAAGRIAIHSLCLPQQRTSERRKEICMAKKAKKADKKSPKKAK
jgi:hypothetical protein